MLRTLTFVLPFLLPGVALAEGALLLDVAGPVSPPVEAFSDVDEGTELDLGTDGVVTLSHYARCEEVTVRGGRVVVGAKNLTIRNSASVLRIPTACSERVTLAESDLTNAAVVTRSLGIAPRVGLEPSVVVAGTRGGNYDLVRFVRGREVVAELPIIARRAVWPSLRPKLQPGTSYTLFLIGEGEQSYGARVTASENAPDRIVLAP